MNKMNLRKTVTRNTSLALLTVALLLGWSCSPLVEKESAAGKGEGWDLLPEILSRIVPPTFPNRDFKVTDYGAVGDGVTDCNPAFRKAIAACTKAGGGRVVVPKGTFLSNGPIHLDNNVNFHVTKDAKVLFGTNFDDYLPHVRVRWEGTECYNYSPLVYAYKKTNIAITGSGTLNGQAESSWAMWSGKTRPGTTSNEQLRKMNHDDVPVEEIKIYAKPTMIEPFECTNVLIEDVTILDYPFWCVHPTYCTNVTIRKLRIESHNSNNDGIDPDSSKDVLIEDCWLDQSDDCLAIKAGRDNSAWRAGKSCENIVIRNMPSNFGGVAIGSECSGGVRNVFIYDCDYDDGNILYCKSNLDRGGFIKDIYVKDLNVGKARVLRLRNNYHGYRGGNFPTEFRNINIENVHIKQGDDETISLQGVEGALVYDVFIKNVKVDTLEKGPILHLRHAENVVLTNVSIAGKIQPNNPPMMPPEEEELEGTASIAPRRSGKWSDASNWETGRDGARLKWSGDSANRLPDDTIDERVLIGKSRVVKDGVTVTLDRDIDSEFEVRVYEKSTFVIPDGFTFKIKGPLIVDRTDSVARQLGGLLDVAKNLDIDAETGQYVITGGSISVGNALSLNEGMFIVDDSRAKITSITVGDEYRTGDGDGDTTTKFIAHKAGVAPIQTQDLLLNAYIGEKLIVDASAYDYAKHGDLELFSYTGTRKGEFDGGPEKPKSQVTVIGAKADLVYDDAGKKIKLTNFRPHIPSAPSGLVGQWGFDDGTGKDLSGHGNDAVLEGGTVYPLGEGQACIQFMPGVDPMRIPASEDSALAISSGTICFWLNTVTGRNTLLKYDNRAVEINAYRGDFQVRFGGEDDFRYWDLVLDYDWPKYDMREFAFYGHPRASIGDSQWHLFAVAYDVKGKKIIGWRDGELISVIDLSTVDIEPLRCEGLTEISTGEGLIGFMDDLRIYNRVLTDAEIREIYDSTKSVYAGRRDTIPTDKKVETYKYRKEDHTLYRAWLQYRPPSRRLSENLLKRIVAEGTNSTIRTAASELTEAVESMFAFKPSVETKLVSGPKVIMGTARTSSWIRKHADELGLNRIENDGFIVKAVEEAADTTLVIVGKVPAGVIFGTFDLIRRIHLGQDPGKLDVLENPQIPLRMVHHWSYFRGYFGDKWRGGGRDNSIYSWEELRTGDTKLIRDWVRLMAFAGWNAICPSEINWSYRNNFLEHLDEVEILAGICRDYGITLFWSPSYLLALDKKTADKLYSTVPDFGGYLLKLGSEKQNGDPRPRMVNRIADNLKAYGGSTLVRAFVYGNFRYTRKPYRNLIPYDIFAPEDGNYRNNVILISKGSPLDWDFAAPIPALDGAIKKNLYGSELVIDKSWPVSWIEKWKWWMEQDNYRNGPGSLNKFDVDCIMGVSMISPSPAWTECPLNMVNYYGMGRLAWNPDLSVDRIYTEWIRLTFGDDPDLLNNIKTILLLSDDVTRKLYMYRGYRGIWIDTGEDNMVQGKTPHTVSRKGIGVTSPELRKRLLDQYAPGLREIYGDRIKGEQFLPYFHFVDYDYRLSNGRTVIQDIYANLDEAVKGAEKMPGIWKRLNGKIDRHRFQYTLDNLTGYIEKARKTRNRMVECFEEKTGRQLAGCFPAVNTPKP